MPLRQFGKYNNQKPLLIITGDSNSPHGEVAAIIYAPSYRQGSTRDNNSKDGHSIKHYPVRFFGRYSKLAPCTHAGLQGGAKKVIAKIKSHVSKVDSTGA